MTLSTSTSEAGFGLAFIASTAIHLAVFLLLYWWSALFPVQLKAQPTYYVDIVNLPTAAPQAGQPAAGAPAQAPPPSKPAAAPMALPAPAKPGAKPAKAPDRSAASATEESAEFDARMNRLQSRAETMHEEAALEKLRRQVAAAGKARPGAPVGSGSQAGSDYLSYITSRLSDAFAEPPNVSRSVFALIRIRIVKAGTKGKVEQLKIIKTSGNIAFDNYAVRSVYEAEKNFPAPPSGTFEFTFRFKPQGISSS